MKNETYFKVGQPVDSFHLGEGVVSAIEGGVYPVRVTFYTGTHEEFTIDGKRELFDKYPSISQVIGVDKISNIPIWEPKDGEYVWCKLFEKSLTYVCYPFKCFDKTTPIVYESQSMKNANQRKVYEIHPFDNPPFSPK